MTKILLIRHGAHDLLGKVLVGRNAVSINAAGLAQAHSIAQRLSARGLSRMFTSPRDRTRETAAPLAEQAGLTVEVNVAFDEMDFGEWAGQSFEALSPLPEWQRWNAERQSAQPPGGETMQAAQRRMVAEIDRLAATEQSGSTIAIFSHGDIIKAALMHYLGVPLNNIARLEVSPGSISTIHYHRDYPVVFSMNEAPE